MINITCFAIGNLDYLNVIKIGVGTFQQYNKVPLVIYLTDNSADAFSTVIKYSNVTFKNIGDSLAADYFNKNKDLFNADFYAFSIDHIADMLMANEVLDRTIAGYPESDVVVRLDMDVLFCGSMLDSVERFYNSGCVVGSSIENTPSRPQGLAQATSNFIHTNMYMNAGNMMFNCKHADLIKDHLSETFKMFKQYDIKNFNFPDQDALNLMYKDKAIYNANPDGWLICVADSDDYKNCNKVIFIHYCTKNKPFNYHGGSRHVFANTYHKYLDCAYKYHCSDIFIAKIKDTIAKTTKCHNTLYKCYNLADICKLKRVLKRLKVI
jgi:lipopolysaccharide biosynthesis glycosyltransferase